MIFDRGNFSSKSKDVITMFYKTILVCLILLPLNSYSISFEDIKEKVRPYFETYLGEKTSLSLLGAPPLDQLQLPPIPKKGNGNKRIQNPHVKEFGKKEKDKYDVSYIVELYKVTRLGDVNNEKLGDWYNVLSQGGSREGIYRAVVLDGTYYELEQKDYPSKKPFLDFVSNHLKIYTETKVSSKNLEQANFFLIKRMMIEKYLEVIDSFSSFEELTLWYGVLSGEMARNYPSVFKNIVRSNTSMKYHKQWAQSVPVDFLKIEVAIKLHKIYNFLNFRS